jgi:hypothetical protein
MDTWIVKGGKGHDRDFDPLASHLPNGLLSTHMGHHEVDQDEVWI